MEVRKLSPELLVKKNQIQKKKKEQEQQENERIKNEVL